MAAVRDVQQSLLRDARVHGGTADVDRRRAGDGTRQAGMSPPHDDSDTAMVSPASSSGAATVAADKMAFVAWFFLPLRSCIRPDPSRPRENRHHDNAETDTTGSRRQWPRRASIAPLERGRLGYGDVMIPYAYRRGATRALSRSVRLASPVGAAAHRQDFVQGG